MILLVTSKVFNLAQIFIPLFFVLFNKSDIDFIDRKTRRLIRFLTSAQMKAFGRQTQDLTQLARLATTTIIRICRGVESFLDFGIFLVLKISIHQSFAIRIISITLSGYEKRLIGYLSFGINIFFNNLLPVIEIPIASIKVRSYWWPDTFPDVIDEKFTSKHGLDI